MTYAEYVTALSNTIVISPTDANFLAILPTCITYAEQRIYREMDLLQTVETNTASPLQLVAGTRTITAPTGMIVMQSASVITPASTDPNAGVRNPLQRVSTEYLNFTWPDATEQDVPEYYAVLDNSTIILAPTPDAAYRMEVVYTVRPDPLSAVNTETILTTYLPDLFFAASMVFMTGWQRDFGAQSEDPRASQSWEAQYNTLLASARVETGRIKSAAEAWQSYSPQPLSTPPRQ